MVNGHFEDLNNSYFKQSTELIEYRWAKGIELELDYVENERKVIPNFGIFFVRPSTFETTLADTLNDTKIQFTVFFLFFTDIGSSSDFSII